ncbi:MAG: transcriptional regulator [Rectinema sp.]
MGDWYSEMAESDFGKARTKELLSRVASFLTLTHDNLLSFDEVKNLVKPSGERYAGMKTVPLDKVIGSEGRYRDFDRHFLPRKEHLRRRWTSIDSAHYKDVVLPPVQLYALGGVYFVRDGNHRISVGRLRGQEEIDAEVTQLDSTVDISPGMDFDALKAAVVAFEKKRFYERTDYLRITGDTGLDFTEPGRYDLIEEHIRVHKYFINQNRKDEIGFDEALWSWHEEVYGPVVLAIREEGLLSHFAGRTASDLYLFLVGHWDQLKKKYGIDFGVGDAARDLHGQLDQAKGSSRPGDIFRNIVAKIREIFKKSPR